jgi:hypothetical protein
MLVGLLWGTVDMLLLLTKSTVGGPHGNGQKNPVLPRSSLAFSFFVGLASFVVPAALNTLFLDIVPVVVVAIATTKSTTTATRATTDKPAFTDESKQHHGGSLLLNRQEHQQQHGISSSSTSSNTTTKAYIPWEWRCYLISSMVISGASLVDQVLRKGVYKDQYSGFLLRTFRTGTLLILWQMQLFSLKSLGKKLHRPLHRVHRSAAVLLPGASCLPFASSSFMPPSAVSASGGDSSTRHNIPTSQLSLASSSYVPVADGGTVIGGGLLDPLSLYAEFTAPAAAASSSSSSSSSSSLNSAADGGSDSPPLEIHMID